MDPTLKTVLDLSGDPTIAVRDQFIIYMNAAARAEFPGLSAPLSADAILNDTFIRAEGDALSGVLIFREQAYHVMGLRCGGDFFYTLRAEQPQARGLPSEGLIAGLLSELSIDRICIDRLAGYLNSDGPREVKAELAAEKCLTALRHSSFRMLRQVTNLNLVSQLREHSVVLSRHRINLVSLCRDLAESAARMRDGEKCAPVTFSTALRELNCEGDEALLSRMLLNLISNAMEHCGPDREIHLRLSETGRIAAILLEDNGPGIRPEFLPNIFSLYQLTADEASMELAASAGLGLSVAEGIARLHGGALMVENRPGAGVRVSVQLPLTRGVDPISIDHPHIPLLESMPDIFLSELSKVLDERWYEPERP